MEIQTQAPSLLVLKGPPQALVNSRPWSGLIFLVCLAFPLWIYATGGTFDWIFVAFWAVVVGAIAYTFSQNIQVTFDKAQNRIAFVRGSIFGSKKKEFDFGQIKEVEIQPIRQKINRTDLRISLVFIDRKRKLLIDTYQHAHAFSFLTPSMALGEQKAQLLAEAISSFMGLPLIKKDETGYLDIKGAYNAVSNFEWV